ncbi:MAG: cyclic nucleotide-binding domain-containing protein [Oscillospiraceae bacterium]|nr:cyclic nucleotide-binding domain-containing protein [Oscillospiraceae bacterium]
METRRFRKGEIIFKQWSLGVEMYEIKSGLVGVYAGYGEDERKLAELPAGSVFGEMAAVDVEPRSATIVALADTEAEVITAKDLVGYFEEKPEMILRVMHVIARRVRGMTDDYLDVCNVIREMEACRKAGVKRGKELQDKVEKLADESTKTQQIVENYRPFDQVRRFGGVRCCNL